MRWNCPHCSTSLAVADEKLPSGWSFSRCYQCSGFALVRKSDAMLIKVDRAPLGESLVASSADSQAETTILGQQAAENLTRLQGGDTKPIIKPAARRSGTTREITRPISPPQFKHAPVPKAASVFGLPEPLPEVPQKNFSQRTLPVMMGIAGAIAVASGIYLYFQGQSLLHRTRKAPTTAHAPIDQPQSGAQSREVIHAPPLLGQNDPQITDQVRERAMAPTRNSVQMLVQARGPNAALRSGPGSQYPSVGVASPEKRYPVTEWNEKWFKVALTSPTKSQDQTQQTAWIRNDLVQVVTAPAR